MATDPVVGVEVFRADLPLREPFRHASSGLVGRLDEVVVRVTLASGTTGWGEVRGNAPYVTGETQGRVIAALTDCLATRLVGARLATPAEIAPFLAGLIEGNTTARAVIEIAVWDARARALGLQVQDLLGAGGVSRVPIHATVPFCAPEEAAARVTRYLDLGIRKVKLRVGLALDEDVARAAAIRAAMRAHPEGEKAMLAVDANQAWSAKQALRVLDAIGAGDLAWVEQPVRAEDLRGLAEVRDRCPAPVIADESCASPADLLRLIEAGAADGFHFKLCKAGGIAALMRMVALAETSGLSYMMGQMDEGMLATAAALHCAAASRPMSCELWGFQRVAAQPFSGIAMEGGAMVLPDAPGLGVTVEAAALVPVARFGEPA